MRALIYCRVSEDRAQGRSVREQEEEARKICEREGWEVAEVVTDSVGASRHSKGRRRGWEQARTLLEGGEVDVLVTWEASRAQRDLSAYAELRDLCSRTGTLWSYSGRTHDLTDSHDRFTTGLDALIAEREADETAERVQRAMRANAATGRPHGRRLFGYQRTYDPTTGALTGQIPDKDEAPIVRRVFADYLAGGSLSSIARALNAEGITTGTGGRWVASQVKRLLTNPAYVAKRVHRGEVVRDAAWPAIVDEDDFDQAQARIAARGTGRGQYGTARLLTKVSRCGLCGGKMFVGHDRNKRKVYQCRTFHHVSRDERMLDDYVTRVVIEYLEQPEVAGALAAKPDPEVDVLRARIAEKRAMLDDAVAQFTAGKLTGATLGAIEAQLLAEISDAEARLRSNVIPVNFAVPSTNVGEWWDKLDDDRRRELIAAVLSAVVIHPTKRGSRTFDPDGVELEWRR